MIEMERSSRREFLKRSPRFDVFERFGQVNAPIIMKPPRADLRLSYPRAFEGSLIGALVIVIGVLRFWPVYKGESPVQPLIQEIVQLEDIEQTRQETRPPPPPRPRIPIEVPTDELLEDVTIASTEIDLAQEVAPPPPQEDFSDEEEFWVAVEEIPQIIGGMASLQKHLVYPEVARRARVAGRVFVVVYVDKKGNVVKTEVMKGIGAGCDEAACHAVEQVRFTPGRQRGKAVKVRVIIPVTFQMFAASS